MIPVNIRSGQGAEPSLEEAVACAATRMLIPCLEAAAIVASEYSRLCQREVVTSKDFEYSLKFAARHVLGNQTETLFPEADDEEDDADEVLSVDESEEVWTRYEGDDERLQMVNRAAETWDDWVPSTPLEAALKRSIDSTLL